MAIDYFNLHQQSLQLGGPGKIVMIDESKFGKRKFNRGRLVKGHWVLGMIEEKGESKDVVMMVVDYRDAETLTQEIVKYVKPGTEIHTDLWKGYSRLIAHGFIHKQVNHSDPDSPFVGADGTHTQRIEATWRSAKTWFRSKSVPADSFADYLMKYIWRRYVR